MKRIFISSSVLICSFAYSQNDSISVREMDDVIIKGKYYRTYTEKEASQSLRLETPILQLPQNIQVITMDMIKDQQILGISDGIIRNVSGATRLEHWADMYARINMRGSRAAAFLNGNNVTSNWGPLSEDMSYVERIEFVKGPAGFMMSNGEPSGIYNIVTKKPQFGSSIHGSAGVTVGSFNLYRAETDVNVPISEKLAFRLNLMGQNRKSFRPNEFSDRYIVAPSLSYKINDKTLLTAEYIYQKAITSEVGSSYVFSNKGYKEFPREFTMTDPGIDPNKMDQHYANINLTTQLSQNWKLTSQISYMIENQLGSDIWPAKVTPEGLIQRRLFNWDAENDMKFAQVFVNGKFQTSKISHKILAGLDMGNKKYMADWRQSALLDKDDKLFNPYLGTYQPPSNGYPKFDNSSISLSQRATPFGTIQQTYTGIYLQDEIGFIEDKLRLTLAARITDVTQSAYGGLEQKATKMTPRIGLSGDITSDFSAYALYDQSFVPQAGFLRNNAEVKPITGDNIEFGLKKDWLNSKFNSTLSFYKITKNNELTGDPANQGAERFSIIKGQSVAQGIEFDTKGELFRGMNIILNYAYTDNKITQSNVPALKVGDKVPGYAQHNFNSWLNYEFKDGPVKGLGFNAGFTFLADRSSWSWGSTNTIQMDDYRKWDAGVFWGNKNMKIIFNVFNLTDEYLYSGSAYSTYYYYQAEAPRNYRLSVNYTF